MNSTVEDEAMSARGNCYPSCIQGDLPEITLHSIMGFGSRNVKKMKILKLTNGEMAKPCDNCKRNRFRFNESFEMVTKVWCHILKMLLRCYHKLWTITYGASRKLRIYMTNHEISYSIEYKPSQWRTDIQRKSCKHAISNI